MSTFLANFLKDEQRAAAIIIYWITGIGVVSSSLAIAILLIRPWRLA